MGTLILVKVFLSQFNFCHVEVVILSISKSEQWSPHAMAAATAARIHVVGTLPPIGPLRISRTRSKSLLPERTNWNGFCNLDMLVMDGSVCRLHFCAHIAACVWHSCLRVIRPFPILELFLN